ncbi:MAG TPA: hypothetical protein VK034_06910, partial [Enhygromyxa sp.]|nr:hypothetical protein [Enhygromyxa sp.]
MSIARRLAWFIALIALPSCTSSDDGGDEIGMPPACIGGLYCPGDLVCVGGFCISGMDDTTSGDGDPTTGDGDPTTGDGDP